MLLMHALDYVSCPVKISDGIIYQPQMRLLSYCRETVLPLKGMTKPVLRTGQALVDFMEASV